MQAIFYLSLKVSRRKWSGLPWKLNAKKISKRLPTVLEDTVVLKLTVDIPYDYLKIEDVVEDAAKEIPVEAVVMKCEVVNYGGVAGVRRNA